jgi:peptidoglycan/xylan/chitin deacetylase (PgdA/CDA1 family)
VAGGLPAAAATAAALGLLAGGTWYASAWPGSQIFGRTLIAGRDPDEVALTFDDGPNPVATHRLLEVLARHEVRASFFAIGAYARREPALIREIVDAGHLLGNHTMHHPRLSIQPAAGIRQELAGCNALLEDITGERVRFFRPPFGARRPYVLQAASELGLTPILWNVTAHDWDPIGRARILANLELGMERNRRLGRGSNLLLHDGSHRDPSAQRMDSVRAVDQLLSESRARPLRFVTVDAWLASSRSREIVDRS